MEKSNEYGLDWWANSEHGGSRNREGDGQGAKGLALLSSKIFHHYSLFGAGKGIKNAIQVPAHPLNNFLML
jgi:hypothetical protein